MKNKTFFISLCLCLIIFSISKVNSQTYRSFSLVHSPGSFEDGYSVGIQFEYEYNNFYLSPEIYLFPNLNDFTYFHFMNRLGFKYEIPLNPAFSIKYNTGPRIGFILRETAPAVYVNLGVELGVQATHTISGWFIRTALSNDWRTDSKLWSNEPTHSVVSVWVTIGKRF